MKRSIVSFVVVSVAALLIGVAWSFGLTDQQKAVWTSLKEAHDLADLGEQAKIAKQNPDACDAIYEDFEGKLIFADSLELWESLKIVGGAIDEATTSNVYKIRMDALAKMTPDQRVLRSDLRVRYMNLHASASAALKARDREAEKDAVAQLAEVAKQFETMGDPQFQAYCLADVGNSHQANENKLDAVKVFDQIDQLLSKAGYRNWNFQGQVKTALDGLKAEGFDPSAKAGDDSVPKGNTATSWAKDEAGMKWSAGEKMKVVISEDLPAKIASPAYTSGENTVAWQAWVLNGPAKSPVDFEERFQPLGRRLKVSRDGVKAFVTDGEMKKPWELTLSAKPQLVEMKREVKDVDGTVNVLKYAFLLATGGDQESLFGMQANFSPRADQMVFRYHAAAYLKGKVLGQDITIYDDNSSGGYGDPSGARLPTNAEQPDFTYNDAMVFGKSKVAQPWTEFLEVDGEFYRLKLDADNYSVVTRKLAVDSGTVKLVWKGPVKPDIVIIEETREFKGAFFAIEKAPVRVPVGLYRVSYGILRKGTKAAQDSCLMLSGKFVSFKVEKDKEHVVELGEPFTFDFKSEPLASGGLKIIGNTVIVYGKSGEMYCHFRDDPPIPDKVVMRQKGGGGGTKPQDMKRATLEDYNKNGLTVWSPLDLEIAGSAGNTYEAQISLQKHAMLGGPIKSEWKQ